MSREEALKVLRDFQTWRRYDGDIFDENAPIMPHPFTVGKAIDVAIEALECLTSHVEKEYYGG